MPWYQVSLSWAALCPGDPSSLLLVYARKFFKLAAAKYTLIVLCSQTHLCIKAMVNVLLLGACVASSMH